MFSLDLIALNSFRAWVHLGYLLNGIHDTLVAGAPTNVSGNASSDFNFGGLGNLGKKVKSREHHPRRTVTALQTMVFPEGFLNRMQFSILGQTLNGQYLPAIRSHRKAGTGFYATPVHDDGTGPTVAGVTADMGSRQLQHLSQEIHQQHSRLDFVLAVLTVHCQSNCLLSNEQFSPLPRLPFSKQYQRLS